MFIDVIANGETDIGGFVTETIIDGSDFGNIGYGSLGTLMASSLGTSATGPTTGSVSFLLPADDFLVIEFDAEIGSRAKTALIPIPAAAWLFGSALGLLGWVRRRAV